MVYIRMSETIPAIRPVFYGCFSSLVAHHNIVNKRNVLFLGSFYFVIGYTLNMFMRANGSMIDRFSTVACALFCIYIHKTIFTETILYCALLVVMYTWIELEFRHMEPVANPDTCWTLLKLLHYDMLPGHRSDIDHQDFRRAVFFITFITLPVLFDTETITRVMLASRWMQRDVYELVIKMCLSPFLCTCAYVVILRLTRSNISKSFGITAIVINFMMGTLFLMIRNGPHDTWLERNTTILDFIIGMGITFLLITMCVLGLAIIGKVRETQDEYETRLQNWLNLSRQFQNIHFSNYFTAYPQED